DRTSGCRLEVSALRKTSKAKSPHKAPFKRSAFGLCNEALMFFSRELTATSSFCFCFLSAEKIEGPSGRTSRSETPSGRTLRSKSQSGKTLPKAKKKMKYKN
ncbi:MAG: hypothetical protein MJY78_11660, partial [Fibrobacter sp.]|nr:hypothetical protein [Fibrobacter sp.]